MNQQTIDKLMELKKLYEAGVLTKEEMEAEKGKILNPSTSQQSIEPKKEEQTEEIAQDAKPLVTDALGHFVFDEPKESVSETGSPSGSENSPLQESKRNKGLSRIATILIVTFVGIFLVFLVTMCGGNKTHYADDTYDVVEAVDTVAVDTDAVDADESFAVDYSQEQTPQSYAERAEDYIGGIDTDTRVIAVLTDDERHCVYTLIEVEAGWGRINSLYCHNLETGSTNMVIVPYKVEGEEAGEQVADAKMVGDNLYVINTSYRCGQSVACLNTHTGKWSCVVRACGSAEFISNNRLKVSYAELVYEGECLADNLYEYKDKIITLSRN